MTVVLTPGQQHESTVFQRLLEQGAVHRPGVGRPRQRPHRVVGDLPNANEIMKNGFTFGNHQHVDAKARDYITRTLKAFVESKR